jgi:hypothetical protein
MPKKTKTVKIDANTARVIEEYIGYDLSGWAEDLNRAFGRDEINAALAELHPLLVARDAAIDAQETGTLPVDVFRKFGEPALAEIVKELPEMNVPQGSLAYHRSRVNAAAEIDRGLRALAA